MRKCKDIIEELHEANLLNFILASLISADTLINEESCEKSMKEMNEYISAIDDTNIEILKELNYYISALNNQSLTHVKEMKQLLEAKRQNITLGELERRFHVFTKYPSTIERELNSFNMIHNRAIDFINQPSYTIDGEDTICLDDAQYLKKNKDGSYTLYVHITYIPSLIPYLSKMNRESIRRAETYYLIDDAYPLYPKYVSNYLASLLP